MTEAVESAPNQSLAPPEVIVVDDGSFDDTRDRPSGDGSHIRFVYQSNRGLPAARDFLGSIPLGPSSAVVRRPCFSQVGLFDETLQSAEDRDMWLRLAASFPGACIEVGAWWYRQRPAQMIRNPQRIHESVVRVFHRFFAEHPEWAAEARYAWSVLYMDSGCAHLGAGDRGAGLRFLLRSAWLHPGPLGSRDLRGRR